MPQRPSLTHHRTFVEQSVKMMEYLQGFDPSQPVPPIFLDWVAQHKIIGQAILRKHTAKNTRKDIRLEARP